MWLVYKHTKYSKSHFVMIPRPSDPIKLLSISCSHTSGLHAPHTARDLYLCANTDFAFVYVPAAGDHSYDAYVCVFVYASSREVIAHKTTPAVGRSAHQVT